MYRGKNGRIILKKEDWIAEWNEEIIKSGYFFVLNVDSIRKQLSEQEMKECSPVELVWIYIEMAKEVWNVDKSGGCLCQSKQILTL